MSQQDWISEISNEVLDKNIEEKVIQICKESGIIITNMDIEECHRHPLRTNPKVTCYC